MVLKREILPGDAIVWQGYVFSIDRIEFVEYFPSRDGVSVSMEFYDTLGNYRSWKSEYDGGYVLQR